MAPPQADIDALVTRYHKGRGVPKAFLNLTAEETRVVETFDQSGRLDKRREIVSDLVVYQARNSADATEYRDVGSVDGKPIKKRGKRALELLARASQSDSFKKELEIIHRESERYDLNFRFNGATYSYGVRLRERQKFRIDWAGRDHVNGHDVVVIDYQEVAPNRNNPDQHFYELFGFTQALCAAAYGSMRRLSNCAANDGNSRGFIRRCHSPSPVSAGKPLIPKAALASLFPMRRVRILECQTDEESATILFQIRPHHVYLRRLQAIRGFDATNDRNAPASPKQ